MHAIRYFLVAVIFACCVRVSVAGDKAIEGYVPDAEKVGSARLQYVLWKVYDATLFAPDGQWRDNAPFALNLEYLMKLEGEEIAKRSVKEMREQGFDDAAKLEQWLVQMRTIFPDVEKGTEITGVVDNERVTRFFSDDQLIGQIEDPEFGKRFFDIWLGEKTTQPELRKQLLGELP